jgi:hypothetical protein
MTKPNADASRAKLREADRLSAHELNAVLGGGKNNPNDQGGG